jgi:hypothetical protein
MNIRLLCRSVLFLFGTFLHEFSHFAVALLIGKPERFSIVPRIEGDSFIFGEVKARVRYRVLGVFVASAPLIWWSLLFFMGKHFVNAFSLHDFPRPAGVILLERLKSVRFRDVLPIWLVLQLLWAGRLSMRDIEACVNGIFSPSGLLLLVIAILLMQIFRAGS